MTNIKPVPVTPAPISGTYSPEPNTHSDIQAASRFPQVSVRSAQNSPPLTNEFQTDVTSFVLDKKTGKLHVMINGVMKSVTFS